VGQASKQAGLAQCLQKATIVCSGIP